MKSSFSIIRYPADIAALSLQLCGSSGSPGSGAGAGRPGRGQGERGEAEEHGSQARRGPAGPLAGSEAQGPVQGASPRRLSGLGGDGGQRPTGSRKELAEEAAGAQGSAGTSRGGKVRTCTKPKGS